MRYYLSNDLLIKQNDETNIIRIENRTNKINTNHIISSDDFSLMDKTLLKKDKWAYLLNQWFSEVKHEWVYDYQNFRKLDNFISKDGQFSTNYILGKDVPYHTVKESYCANLIMVYHHGYIYYHNISYNGYLQGFLLDIYTYKVVKWTRLKNCAPILNIKTKKIC